MFSVLENIFNWFKNLFGITPRKTSDAQTKQNTYAENYKSTSEAINLTATTALKLTNIIISEAKSEVKPKTDNSDSGNPQHNPRIDFLNMSLQDVVNELNIIVMRTLGIGGVIIKPYIVNGHIYSDILPQTRFFVIERFGKVITKAGFIADYIKSETRFSADEYMRLEYHSLDENVNSPGEFIYTIENKALKNGVEVPLSSIAEWAEIPAAVTITGVDKMLFAFIKCPVDNREAELNSADSIYGVPITYGQQTLIKMIVDILNEIPDEYKNKKAFIGADDLMFDRNKLPESGLYKIFRAGGGSIEKQSMWEIFSPEIRQTSYFEGINNLLELLEKAIGVNKGLLTDLRTGDATATAIEYSSFDTESLADAMHKNIETGFRQLVYAFNVLANAFDLSPSTAVEYDVSFDWMNWSERSSERYSQLLQGEAAGAVNAYEIRQYLFDESKEKSIANLPEQIADMPISAGE